MISLFIDSLRTEIVNFTFDNGSIPIHFASHSNSIKVARLLIEKGTNVNAKDVEGYTPLYVAALYNSKETALLIQKGANINVKSIPD